MAGPGLPVNTDTTYADSSTDPSVKVHQQHHDLIHTIVNDFDVANGATAGFVPVGDGTTLVARALLSTDNPGVVTNGRTASYTLVAADAGKLVEMAVASANTLTVPAGVFAAGQIVAGRQYGAGTTTVTAGAGLTLRSRSGAVAAAGQYAEWTITFRSASEAVLAGDLA